MNNHRASDQYRSLEHFNWATAEMSLTEPEEDNGVGRDFRYSSRSWTIFDLNTWLLPRPSPVCDSSPHTHRLLLMQVFSNIKTWCHFYDWLDDSQQLGTTGFWKDGKSSFVRDYFWLWIHMEPVILIRTSQSIWNCMSVDIPQSLCSWQRVNRSADLTRSLVYLCWHI